MKPLIQLVVFKLDGQFYALELEVVERVVRAVEVTPLPNAPAVVLGIINVQGRIIPVMNLRRRFRLPEREIDLSDQFIITHSPTRPVALVVDAVTDMRVVAEQDISAVKEIMLDLPNVPYIPYIQGVAKLAGDLILIHDLDLFLSPSEEETLDEALDTQIMDAPFSDTAGLRGARNDD